MSSLRLRWTRHRFPAKLGGIVVIIHDAGCPSRFFFFFCVLSSWGDPMRLTGRKHPVTNCRRGFSFTWWGCCGLCQRHKPTELAHSFVVSSRVCRCLYWPFNCILFQNFSRQLSALSLCSPSLNSALLVLSTTYLFTKVSLSPNIIFCGWLGLKQQLTY